MVVLVFRDITKLETSADGNPCRELQRLARAPGRSRGQPAGKEFCRKDRELLADAELNTSEQCTLAAKAANSIGGAPKAAASSSRARLEIIPRCSFSPGETLGQCCRLRALPEQESHGCTGPGMQQRAIKLITGLEPLHVRRN